MGKITFRADDDLVDELEAFDASKSEVMREALREYLANHDRTEPADAGRSRDDRRDVASQTGSIDELVRARVDDRLEQRFEEFERRLLERDSRGADVDVTIALEGAGDVRTGDADVSRDGTTSERGEPTVSDSGRAPEASDSGPVSDTGDETADGHRCGQCGESVDGDHVYCPNCGEKVSRRLFCECGDELRSDWSFCPGCGRRTPAADVLDTG